MWEMFHASENIAFSVALLLMLLLAVLEVIALLIGMPISDSVESLLPEPDVHVEIGEPSNSSLLTRFLGWLRVGKVPVLMLFVIFLLCFGLLGLFIQNLTNLIFSFLLPSWIAIPVVVFLSLAPVRWIGGVLERLMPTDETTAINEDALLGRTAIIVLGQARKNYPAQAKVKDQHGYTHYIYVEPDTHKETLNQGDQVILLTRNQTVFTAVLNTNPLLSITE